MQGQLFTQDFLTRSILDTERLRSAGSAAFAALAARQCRKLGAKDNSDFA
jgi:hypothetical protein